MFDQQYAERVYDWWSDHPRLFGVLSTLAFAGREAELRAASVDRLDPRSDETVLDLACGTGVNFPRLAPHCERLVAVDYSSGMVEAADERRRQRSDDVHVVRGDATSLPLTSDSIDAAYSSLSLSAIPDYRAAIEETYRVLCPGGRFVVLDARPFQSFPATLLNPLWSPLSALATNWDPEADVLGALGETFDAASFRAYNGGTFFIATCRKE